MDKADELYLAYLNKKLDLVFDVKTSRPVFNSISFDIIEDLKKNYDEISEYKDGYAIVKKDKKYNIINSYSDLISERWYDEINYIGNGIAQVKIGPIINFIDSTGKLIYDDWYNEVTEYGNKSFVVTKGNRKRLINPIEGIITGWYDDILESQNGYIKIRHYDKYNYIDKKGNLVSWNWVSNNNYDIVRKDGKYNFVDKNNKPISNEWYDYVDRFAYGFAKVGKDKKFNFINENGELVSNEWYDEVADLINGYAVVKNNNKQNLMSSNGSLVSQVWYDEVDDLKYGYVKVKNNNKYNFISEKNGKLLLDNWYDKVGNFENDYAIVNDKDKGYNYVSKSGNLISKEWFEEVNEFENGLAIVKVNNKENLINILGEKISKNEVGEIWYDKISRLENELFKVTLNGKSTVINKSGKQIVRDWFDSIENQKNGYIKVSKNGKKNLLNEQGFFLSDKWVDEIGNYENGYATVKVGDKEYKVNIHDEIVSIVKKDDKYNYQDSKGHTIWEWQDTEEKLLSLNKKILYGMVDLGDYNVTKKLFGYKCAMTKDGKKDSFRIKYRPMKKFGKNHILCYDVDTVYLYDRKSRTYELLGSIYDVKYDNNFIYDGEKVYIIYDDRKFNITDYYMKNLKNSPKVSITKDIKGIMSKREFNYELESGRLKEAVEEKKEEPKKKKTEEEIKKEEQKKLQQVKQQQQQEEENRKKEKKETLRKLRELIEKLNSLKDVDIQIPKIKVNNLLVDVDDHKEIIEEYKEFIPYIDLSMISFKNVDIAGINFHGSNAHITPQEVYKKSLNGCDFTGVHFEPIANFSDIDIRGAKFSADSDPKTLDMMPLNIDKAMYDENTTYNNKSLIELLDEAKKVNNQK